MKIALHDKDNEVLVEVPYDSAAKLPEIVYQFKDGVYKFYRKGYAANSTMFFETEALHVPD